MVQKKKTEDFKKSLYEFQNLINRIKNEIDALDINDAKKCFFRCY